MGTKFQEKKGKWRTYSTIVDDFTTGWLTKEEMIVELQERIIERAKADCDKVAAEFPNGYFDMDSRMIIVSQEE